MFIISTLKNINCDNNNSVISYELDIDAVVLLQQIQVFTNNITHYINNVIRTFGLFAGPKTLL